MTLTNSLTPIIRILSAVPKDDYRRLSGPRLYSGDKELVFWGMTKGGIPIAYEGPPIDEAIKWAAKHCAQLVTKWMMRRRVGWPRQSPKQFRIRAASLA